MQNLAPKTACEYESLLEPLLGDAAGYAQAVLRNRADAQDVVQEAALKGWQAFATYDRARPFKGWWFTILRNCFRDVLRRRTAEASRLRDRARDLPAARRPEQWRDLSEAMDRLSESHREIVRLRYFARCSYRQIASVLNIPEGTVMSRLHAARLALAAEYLRDGT